MSLYDLLGPEFVTHADALFAPDRFHPSGLGYRRIGAVLLPAVLTGLGTEPPRARRQITAVPHPPS